MEKARRIIESLQKKQSISEIARNERINRHSVSLIKQTMEIYEQRCRKSILKGVAYGILGTLLIMIIILIIS